MKKIGFLLLMITLMTSGFTQNKVRSVFDDAEFVIEPMNLINTIGSDISPALVQGKLYFSAVPEIYFNKKALERKNKAFYDTYSASLDENGNISSEREMVSGLGNKYHQGPVSYSTVTGELFVTISNTIDPDTIHKMFSAENIRLRLVIMKKTNNEWVLTEELPFNNKKFHFAHPAISQTGDTLIFSSDMEGNNYGKSDLYMSVRTKGKWSDPVNLGNVINTSGNEMFPTFLPGGLLSFASDGRQGTYGGLDIWYTNFPNPTTVINPGDKINSTLDDFGLIISANRKTGYFASNRSGKGSDDLFMLQINSLYETMNGRVVDDRTGLPIAGSVIQLLDCNGKSIGQTESDSQGNFQVKVLPSNCPTLEVSKTGYQNTRKSVAGSNYIEIRLKQLDTFLTIKVVDKDTGEDLADSKLEVTKGEFDPSSLTKAESAFRLKLGKESDYIFNVSKAGYFPASVNYSGKDKTPGENALVVTIERVVAGKQFVLENLYYDVNKYNIRPDAEVVLDRLIQVLTENPEIRIELGSHTDCRASSNYNNTLSQNRSNSAVAYLIKKGILAKRLVAKGYGETQLVNKCADGVDCSEAEHQANRRTVIKILGATN